jgi:hypothetical protein
MMIAITISLLLTFAVSIQGSHLPHLRSSATSGEKHFNDVESSCNSAQDAERCFRTTDTTTQKACMWCVAGAIPSECMSPTQAELLPPDVFDCASPNVENSHTEATTTTTTTTTSRRTSFRFDSEIFGTTQIYSLVHDGHHHDHTSHENVNNNNDIKTPLATEAHAAAALPPQPSKSDLCDDSSNSLSGYLDITGSEYDASDENKHLFFWFFEKRNSDLSPDTPVCIRLSLF